MAKKYLNHDEAAAILGISPAELNGLREEGSLRAFADRGTWKFKADEVEELARSRQATSDPDIPLYSAGSEESVHADDEDELGSQPTIIRRSVHDDEEDPGEPAASDSDVRLIMDDSLQYESDADIPLSEETSDSDVQLVGGSAELVEPEDEGAVEDASVTDVQLVSTDVNLADSDSDVRLVYQDRSLQDSDSDVQLVPSGASDVHSEPAGEDDNATDLHLGDAPADENGTDVYAVAPSDGPSDGTDSDVQLVTPSADDDATNLHLGDAAEDDDSDSDVRIMSPVSDDSDSDVTLAPAAEERRASGGSDSDVKLVAEGTDEEGSDSDVKLVPDDEDEDALLTDGGSGLAFDVDDDAGASIFADDEQSGLSGETVAGGSGMLLEPADSGISLEGRGSGVRTDEQEDSGLTLEEAGDSGFTLDDGGSGLALDDGGSDLALDAGEDLFGDSDITFDDGGSGVALEAGSSHDERTAHEMDMVVEEDPTDRTAFEIPAMDDDEENVALFDDDTADEEAHTVVRGGAVEEEEFDSGAELGEFEDDFEEFDEELEVAAEVEGEDDELADVDVFGEEEEFEEEFREGAAPAFGRERIAAPVQQDWGAATFVGLLAGVLLLSFCGMAMYDLVRSMWAVDGLNTADTGLLQSIAGFFAGS